MEFDRETVKSIMMDDTIYVCVRDFDNQASLLGKAKTIDEWKSYIIDDRKKALEEIFSTTDKDYIDQMNEVIRLKENEVIPYIRDVWDVKLIPLENKEQKFLIIDECRLVTEKELRKMLLFEETNDIINNVDDYVNKDLPLDEQLRCIKTALDGDIDMVIEMANSSWNIPIVKVKRG